MIWLYRFCDVVIQSDALLPELPAIDSGEPGIRFEVTTSVACHGGDAHWYHHWRPSGAEQPWLSFAHVPNGYLLRFPNHADFFISAETRYIKCQPKPGTAESTIRHLFLDQVMPLVMSRREKLVLHASAVATENGAVAFAGLSGAGKSTLAASFVAAGFALLTDDCLVLRENGTGWSVIPSYPGGRLWPDSFERLFSASAQTTTVAHYTSKLRVGEISNGLNSATTSVPLACIFVLEPAAACKKMSEPLSGQSAFMTLVNFAYNLDVTDREVHEEQFRSIPRLVREVTVRQLAYPGTFASLPTVRQHVLESCAARSSR